MTRNWFRLLDERAQARFWQKVTIGDPDQCWDWKKSLTTAGYGQFMIAPGVVMRAHRIAWALAHRRSPGRRHVRHRCDRPICCNPKHLLIGTHADNVADMVERGRNYVPPPALGDQHPGRKVTAGEVHQIRQLRAGGALLKDIAAKFGIGISQVKRICDGNAWAHIPTETNPPAPRALTGGTP